MAAACRCARSGRTPRGPTGSPPTPAWCAAGPGPSGGAGPRPDRVDNQGFPHALDKPLHTTYLQTWHGSAYKRMGFDEARVKTQNEPQRRRRSSGPSTASTTS
ncbi:CDP-glycerol glycerophosphotransferase family protein [Streptomyces albidoflavus]